MARYHYGRSVPPHHRYPVSWYNPAILLHAAQEMASTSDQLRNFDRRETYTGKFHFSDLSQQSAPDGNFWWDYVSDTGDGGNAAYSVALATQSSALYAPAAKNTPHTAEPAGDDTYPTGRLLILGGDLCYPGACAEEYQYRFIEMWEGACTRNASNDTSKKTVLAIPQNHDWFDNSSTFHRYFINYSADSFVGAETPQERTYFATKLPHGWWLFGLDFALVGDIDRKQYDAFLQLIEHHLQPEDNVVLVYPTPYWTRPLGDDARAGYPKRYQRLEAVLQAKKIHVRIRLAGDLHHYVREDSPSDDPAFKQDLLITCGSGGAFLHPTHTKIVQRDKVMDLENDPDAMFEDLQSRVRVGTSNKTVNATERRYKQVTTYPDKQTSYCLAMGNILALFGMAGKGADRIEWSHWWGSNLMFSFVLGLLYCSAVYSNAFVFSASFVPDQFVASANIGTLSLWEFICIWGRALFFSPLALGVHIILIVMCASIAMEDGWKVGVTSGFPHALFHILSAATLYWAVSQFTSNGMIKLPLVFISGTLIGGALFGLYFALMSSLGYLTNNAFSPLSNQDYKGFLRFKIDADGNLHGYMIGNDKTPKRWKNNPGEGFPIWHEDDPDAKSDWRIRDRFELKS